MTLPVFVVDDNRLTRELLSDALRSSGYEPVAFASPADALAAIKDDPPAACLVDHMMPGMSGADLIRALRGSGDERLRELPVIGVSSGFERELLAAGATSCVRKPVSEASISAALAAAVRNPAPPPVTAATPAPAPIDEFRKLHERARTGLLAGNDLALYRAMRTELAQTFLAMQHIALPARSRARRALRVAAQFRVDLQLGGQPIFTEAIDLGQGGFSVVLGASPPLGAKIGFRLHLGPAECVEGIARLANSAPADAGKWRAGFAFVGLTPEQTEQVELRVFDAVVEQLGAARS